MQHNHGVPASPSGLRPFGAEPQDASQAEPLVPNAGSALSRAWHMGADARARTIAAWLRTLVDWNVPLDRAADWIEAGVPWSDSEQPDGGSAF